MRGRLRAAPSRLEVRMSTITMRDVSVMGTSYVHYPFEFFLDSMAELGIGRIDLWGAEPFYCRLDYPDSWAASRRLRAMRRLMEERGQCVTIYTPETLGYPYSLCDPNPALTLRTIEFFKWAFEDAHELGCGRVFVNSGCGLRSLPREESLKRCTDTLATICDLAEAEGIVMPLEQLQPYESNLVTTLPDVRRVLETVSSPALRVCVDLTAMEVQGETLDDYFDCFGDKVEWVHYSDAHHEAVGSGSYGREKLAGFIRTLEERDFENGIDLEINDSIYWEDPHSPHEATCRYLREELGLEG